MSENRDFPFCKKCNSFYMKDFKYCPFCATELEIIKDPSFEKWAKGEYKEKELYNIKGRTSIEYLPHIKRKEVKE